LILDSFGDGLRAEGGGEPHDRADQFAIVLVGLAVNPRFGPRSPIPKLAEM